VRREADLFEGVEPQLVFIAKRLADARSLEEILTAAGVDYAVEPDEYHGGVIFQSVRIGAFFYVRPEERERAVNIMLGKGYVPLR
jgi:hypothetical protein